MLSKCTRLRLKVPLQQMASGPVLPYFVPSLLENAYGVHPLTRILAVEAQKTVAYSLHCIQHWNTTGAKCHKSGTCVPSSDSITVRVVLGSYSSRRALVIDAGRAPAEIILSV